jgi:hypothetical protein
MNDHDFCLLIARIWVDHGGDTTDFLFCQGDILKEIRRMKEEESNVKTTND